MLKIKRFMLGPILEDGYVVYENDGELCYIIDPGYEPGGYISFVDEHSLKPAGILLTHLHGDHTGAADALKDAFGCVTMMHEQDAFVYKGVIDVMLKDGDVIPLGSDSLKVIHTPGHTKGSVCFLSEKSKVCFTGDTVFDTDLGRTDLKGGSEQDMVRSIRNVVDGFANDIHIYPGHEGDCTMKYVRKFNSEFNAIVSGKGR
ncbi:MAG: MBL fold metallo-hydrolase [Eubacterium sp.]|nr:MBL fold metallo-hydrolase [Eubacterium sp.]